VSVYCMQGSGSGSGPAARGPRLLEDVQGWGSGSQYRPSPPGISHGGHGFQKRVGYDLMGGQTKSTRRGSGGSLSTDEELLMDRWETDERWDGSGTLRQTMPASYHGVLPQRPDPPEPVDCGHDQGFRRAARPCLPPKGRQLASRKHSSVQPLPCPFPVRLLPLNQRRSRARLPDAALGWLGVVRSVASSAGMRPNAAGVGQYPPYGLPRPRTVLAAGGVGGGELAGLRQRSCVPAAPSGERLAAPRWQAPQGQEARRV
jgi:hypothetical protein